MMDTALQEVEDNPDLLLSLLSDPSVEHQAKKEKWVEAITSKFQQNMLPILLEQPEMNILLTNGVLDIWETHALCDFTFFFSQKRADMQLDPSPM